MKKRLLILMTLLGATVAGAWAQTTKTIYVYPKAWDMTGCKIALYAWSPSSMFDDLQKSTTYPECYTIEVDNDLETCILVQLPETASNDWSNKISQTYNINLEGVDDNILIIIKDSSSGDHPTEVTTIDHLNEYLTPVGSVVIDETNFPDEGFRTWLKGTSYGADGYLTDEEIASVEEMYIGYFEVYDLTGIKYFTELKTLNAGWDNMHLTTLDVSGMTKLETLYCEENELTSLNVSGCTSLKWLECFDNHLTTLDVSDCTNLLVLSCGKNQLTSINLSGLTSLNSLVCEKNKLTSLNVSGCIGLVYVRCYDNMLNQEAMGALIEMLPTPVYHGGGGGSAAPRRTPTERAGELVVKNTEGSTEQNVITNEQVILANDKNWTVYSTEDGQTETEIVAVIINDEVMDQLWNEYAYDGEVGPIYSPESTTIKVWNPLSTSVKLNLYATGSDIEEGAAKLGTYTMDKLMDGDRWTGIWTYTINGDFKNKYYTYTIDGTEAGDPWAMTAGKDNQRSMVCDEPTTNPGGWDSDYHRFYEQGNAVAYINVPEFTADPMCGVSEANRGKYLALTEDQTTYGNAGEEPTCMAALKEDGTKAIVVDIAAPLMMPDQYVSNPYDGNCLVSEFKQMVQAVHDTFGMSLFIRLDFSSIPPYDLPYQPQPGKYIYESCLHWVNEYHVDGIVLATDIDTSTRTLVRDLLDAIDSRLVLATVDELAVMTSIEGISRNGQTTSHPSSIAVYTLDGRKLNGKPTQKGVYIYNKRKVVIK